MSVPSFSLLLFLQFAAAGVVAQAPDQPPPVFDLPGLRAAQAAASRQAVALFAQKDYAAAEKLLRQACRRIPHDFNAQYNLACALARLGKQDEALASLKKAVELGYRGRRHIEGDEDLLSLRGDERFGAILKSASQPPLKRPIGWEYQAKSADVKDGQALVTENNVAWDNRLGMFRALFKFGEKPPADRPIAKGLGKAGELLRRWQAEGTAAGNHGGLYDNHDSDHSNMNYATLPQLTRVEFSEAAKKRRLHHGLAHLFLFNAVTIGNSSTAITSGRFWRSQGRHALTRAGGAELLYLHYRNNHLYFYPEHRDHDPGHNGKIDGKTKAGHGDVFPANTPYLILSQGSSGSDRAFLNAVAATLAAFRPEVKQSLIEAGLLMPAVQMIFRISNKNLTKPGDYLTGKAHPTVFDGKQIDVVKMVAMAHDMQATSLPPLAQIKVVEEDQGVVGRDYFDARPRERLFDTPCAVARVVKSTKHLRRMVVSAEASRDPRGKPLTFHWSVLRGDAKRIRVKKLNESGSVAELLVPYHPRRPVTPGSKLESNRVDIGVFVHNGDYYSAPAFISLGYLDNEKRVYDEQHRIRVVDYTDPAMKGNYVGPLLDFPKDWRDEYRYAKDGALEGWTRIRGKQRQEFTAEGRRIMARDAKGKPTETRAVRYVVRRRQPRQPPVLEQVDETTD